MAQNLLSSFAPANKADWLKQANKDLKGKDFDETLVWKTPEGINIEPYYAIEDIDLEKIEAIQEAQKTKNSLGWQNRPKVNFVNEKETNLLVINILEKGVDALTINFEDKNIEEINFIKLLNGIKLSEKPIYFQSSQTSQIFNQLSTFIHYQPKGGFVNDCLNDYFTGKIENIDTKTWESAKKMIVRTSNFPQFKSIFIASHPYHNSGANAVQELAFTLNSAVTYLDKLTDLGLNFDEILPKIEFSISIGTNYFLEIAKLRALRFLWGKVVSEFQSQNPKSNRSDGRIEHRTVATVASNIHCQTSTFYDSAATPNTNMLRATTEAMSAIIGGCDALSIHGYDEVFQETTEFSERIARNISNLMKEEAHLDKTHDASAGSYFIEKLTIDLAEKAWELFTKIEEKGGIIDFFESGKLRKEIDKSFEEKIAEIEKGKILVGVNKFRVDSQPILKKEKQNIFSDKILIDRRLAEKFE